MQKVAMPFQRFWPPLFCLISPEVFLPGKSAVAPEEINSESKRVKARQKSGPGSMACSVEAFFCLDFFWYFFVSRQKRTSLRGN
jgi:hypothetical protein